MNYKDSLTKKENRHVNRFTNLFLEKGYSDFMENVFGRVRLPFLLVDFLRERKEEINPYRRNQLTFQAVTEEHDCRAYTVCSFEATYNRRKGFSLTRMCIEIKRPLQEYMFMELMPDIVRFIPSKYIANEMIRPAMGGEDSFKPVLHLEIKKY